MGKKKYVFFTVGALAAILCSFYLIAGEKAAQSVKGTYQAGSGEVFLLLGNEFYARGDYVTALKLYSRGLEYEPDNEYVLNNVGYCHIEKGDMKSAEEYLKKAVSKNGLYQRPRENLAHIYYEQARYADAVVQLKRLTALDATNPSYQYDLGINIAEGVKMNSEGDLDEAITAFETAESLSPGYAHAKENIRALHDVKKALHLE